MTSVPPTRAVANLHLHLEYDSGLDVIAAAMATVPEGDKDTDDHRAHVSNDVSAAVAHLLDINALTPEGCPIRITDVALDVSVDLEDHFHDDEGPETADVGHADDPPAVEIADAYLTDFRKRFEALDLSDAELAAMNQTVHVAGSVGPPPVDFNKDNFEDVPKFTAQWAILCGYFAGACSEALDSLFDDLVEASDGMPLLAPRADDVAAMAATHLVSSFLPEHWATEYTTSFLRKFIVVTADVTTRLASVWSGPSSIAEVLAVWYLLQLTAMRATNEEVALRHDMFHELKTRLLYTELDTGVEVVDGEDILEALYDGEDYVAFANWFLPFEDSEPTSPYTTAE